MRVEDPSVVKTVSKITVSVEKAGWCVGLSSIISFLLHENRKTDSKKNNEVAEYSRRSRKLYMKKFSVKINKLIKNNATNPVKLLFCLQYSFM